MPGEFTQEQIAAVCNEAASPHDDGTYEANLVHLVLRARRELDAARIEAGRWQKLHAADVAHLRDELHRYLRDIKAERARVRELEEHLRRINSKDTGLS